MKNMDIYEKVRAVPQTAQKTIQGGRLKGFTDINPMWRIQTLTEQFGPCGFGWYIEIKEKWIETSPSGESIANVLIELYVKIKDTKTEEWSKPIIGIGGSRFISSERNGVTVSDECFKMALTDAISVACKNLGVGADIYWSQGRTKYDTDPEKKEEPKKEETKKKEPVQKKPTRLQMIDYIRKSVTSIDNVCAYLKVEKIEAATTEQIEAVYKELKRRNESNNTGDKWS